MQSLVDVVRTHAADRPDALAYTFLEDGEAIANQLTFAQLDEQARVIGATLQQLTKPGDRAILLYQPGLEFVVAFLGCQYAGVVAVPALPPNMSRVQATVDRLSGVVGNASPAIMLTTAEMLPTLRGATRARPEFAKLLWQATNRLSSARAAAWQSPQLGGDDLSFLQYTSGSTSAPKGVMVSQSNILANLAMLRATCAIPDDFKCLGWLPLFHDMGLIGITLLGLYQGTETRLMSPLSFLKRPMRWLQAIAAHGDNVVSGGPNFAYDAVLRRVSAADKQGLDLRGWTTAFCGSETVRTGTLERFLAEFAECGLERKALLPCYGLAEATLVVSGRTPGRDYRACELDKPAYERGTAAPVENPGEGLSVVSCGVAQCGQEIAIVDPTSRVPCGDSEIGEVWVRGDNVAKGYWDNPERSLETFCATTSDGEGPFLRTGDLGFSRDGELYITGRLKELIIIRGRCIYPQDLEHMVESMVGEFPELIVNESVAFALTDEQQERIGLIVKIARRQNPEHEPEALIEAIQARALEQFDVGFAEIALVKSSVPKTSSGKKMRRACAQHMLAAALDDEFRVEHHWRQAGAAGEVVANQAAAPAPSVDLIGHAELAAQIVDWLAREQQIDPANVSIHQPFTDFGLDSFVVVSLIDFLERRLETVLDSSMLSDHRNIDELSRHLVERQTRAGKAASNHAIAGSQWRKIG